MKKPHKALDIRRIRQQMRSYHTRGVGCNVVRREKNSLHGWQVRANCLVEGQAIRRRQKHIGDQDIAPTVLV